MLSTVSITGLWAAFDYYVGFSCEGGRGTGASVRVLMSEGLCFKPASWYTQLSVPPYSVNEYHSPEGTGMAIISVSDDRAVWACRRNCEIS